MRFLYSFITTCCLLLLSGFSSAQTVTVIAPNGGEILYACQQYPVTWSQTGSPSNYWNIDYSLDGGTIWASVTSNYLSTNGLFLWTVPTVQSSTVKLRIYDAQNPTTADQSNNFFTINIPVILTSPNGGEVWQGNTVHNITWNAQGTSNTYNIAYSVNNGSTWTNIVTNHSNVAGSYAWTLPAIAQSTTCLVRVMDAVTNCMQDVSNAVFTITPATPILISPNGGETLQAGCDEYITWNTATLYTAVTLEYSLNNGSTWTTIVNGTGNDGGHYWSVPYDIQPSTQCLIRITNYQNLAVSDVSNSTFTVAQPVTLTYPNGGETLIGCATAVITWTKSTCVGAWNISYSIDGGATYTSITTTSDNGSNTQSYNWTVPNGITATALIRVRSSSYNTLADISNASFNIIPSNDITVTSANGGESWVGLSSQTLTWTNLPTASGFYNLQYSTNNGSNWVTIASNVTGNSFNWNVPNIPSTTALIKVIDAQNTCKFDVSNAVFTILPATPILISPNGGETLQAGCDEYITWNTSTLYTAVTLEYSLNNGATWTTIINGTGNDGGHYWSVPYDIQPSTQCLIRITNYQSLAVSDVSNSTFTVAQPVTLTYPNGGETLIGCATAVITWTKSTCVGAWNIGYSIDGGATYTSITTTSDNGSNTQSYNWTVPNGITATALIRVRSSSYNTLADVSNASFNIIPSNDITVTSANGGESWVGLSSQTLTWTNLPTASGFYNLQYSTNNGSNWVTIANNVTGNSFNWNVPNIPSTTALIKVIDAQNTCKFDVSNAVFTILPATPILISPNGGETLQAGCDEYITWNTATLYTAVTLEYSLNNGSTWTTIVNGTSNDGGHYWSVPYDIQPSTQCLIRITNYQSLAVSDVSNSTFTVAQPVTLTYPNGGETLIGCATAVITWTKSTCVGAWNIGYSIDGGATYTSITTASDNGSNTQSYNWTVPNGITATALIRVRSSSYNTLADVSNASFNIIPSNDITVTSANGGESWVGLSSQTLTWTNLPTASGFYNLQYSTNNGSNWVTIASNVTGNSFNWNVPNIPSTTALIKVIDAQNTCKFDVSNAVFTILPATPILISPNGGETLQAGCDEYITWNTSTLYTAVTLEYSLNNGATWTTIINGTGNDGGHYWTVPYDIQPSTQCLIRITNYQSLAVSDVSNSTFTVAQPVTLTYPNGGETLIGCATAVITWTKSTCVGAWNIGYSIDGGATYTSITTTSDNGSNTQSYNWTVPNGITATALIRVRSSSYNTLADVSNASFNIIPSNDITVTSANGGESWVGLSSQTLTWTNLPTASGFYNLQYSTNNGSNWVTIANNVTGNSYNWNVPNIPSTTALIKVIDAQNTCKFDVSNAVFTILPATPILISPNGGETLQAGCDEYITWNTSTLYTAVTLEYSLNNGATWTTIINGTGNDGGHYWTVPYDIQPSTQCLIRITNYQSLAVSDVSNSTFTIAQPVTLTYPNGGETLIGCATAVITWTKSTCVGAWNIGYSIDGGATYTSITTTSDNGSNTQSYNWTVPNGITATALIRVRSSSYNTLADVSNASFNIIPSNDITVTSANGGESWVGLSSQTLTWTNLPTASGFYNLQYSTNNGSNWVTIANNITGNSFNWNVPNIPSTTALIKVIDAQNTCKFDVSNAVFTILPATPILISPNGGETLYSGTDHYITWNTATLYTAVTLEYSLNNGATWTTIINGTGNDGGHYWSVPNVSSTTALVRISNYQSLAVSDVSNQVFTIKPAVTILTPNGDDGITLWGGCTITSITFDRSPAWNSYRLEYSTNGGSSWNLIASNWTTSANPATYNWTMPNLNNVPTLVRVYPTSNTPLADQSDNTFTIRKPVTIIQPNFGGVMQIGTTYNIQWTSDGISNLYDIFYSTNGGASFTNIVTGYNTSNNTFPWLVPNIPSSNCRIWVRDNVNSCKSDTSDIAFIISPNAGPITIQTPNGVADTLQGCDTKVITWSETTAFGTYDIHYSTNGGSTWTAIVTNYATSNQSYSWAVPNINSATVLLRVRQAGSSTNFDLSDAYFVIEPRAVVATPPTTTLCPGQSIQLVATGGNTYSWSPSAGLSNAAIANPIATPSASTQYIVQSIVGACTLRDTVQVNVTPASLTASVSIQASETGTICTGTSVTFTATPVNGGTAPSYQWKVNGSNVGTNSTTFSSSSLTNNDVVTCVMTSDIPCIGSNPATSNAITMQVSSSLTPTVSVSASPSTTACFGSLVVFTATPVNGGSTPVYQWKLNGNNVGTNSATYSSSSLNNNDVITVVMTSNASCLATNTATSSNVTMTITNLPGQPGSIIGNTNACVGSTQTYQVTAAGGATSYTWSLPNGWTGTSTSNSISLTVGATAGNVSVTANNGCGSGAPSQTTVTPSNAPAQPGLITGNTTFCQGDALAYSITAVNGATSYTWSLPSGWSGTSSTTSISATAGSTSGNISVTANNACGASTAQALAVNAGSAPAQPGTITGNSSYCLGQEVQYSISAVNEATSYTWTLPNGWTGISTTTSISTVGSSAGTISVTANGSCGSSTAQTLVVAPTLAPAQPNAIVGNSNYCQGSQELYSVNPVSGATSYTWTLPNGWTGNSTSNSIAANTGTLGTISVVANGECGNSTPQTLSVAPATLPNQPTTISGNDTICAGVATNYFIEPVQGANSYVWTTSGGLTGSSTSNSIDILGENTGGVITVAAQNICLQTGPTTSLELQILSLDTSVVLNGSELVANAVDVSYQWLDCNNGFVPISNETAQNFIIPGIGSYAVELSRNGCIDTSSCIEIEVVGLSDQPSNNLVVYPNPAYETITIKTSKPVEIYMYNALGAVVDHFELNGSKEINIAHLANGMYILQTNGYGNYRLIKH